jgi:hypothetical protein
MDKIKLSPLELDSSYPIRRTMPRPANLRQPDYEDRFDFLSIFYDCFESVDATWRIFLGPPLLNLEPIVLPALPTVFRCRSSSDVLLRHLTACTQLWLRIVENRAVLPLGVFHQTEITVQPNHCDLFHGRNVLLTLSKENDLCWIRDWVHFFARKHGSDAVLFYDNASTNYEISEIRETILSIPGIEVTVVVPWPYKYGPGSEEEGLPWDSEFSQSGVLEHARHRFLTLAEAVVNADVDELVLTKNKASVFDLVQRSHTGYLKYTGHWIESATESTGADRRHFDFVYRSAAPADEPYKWTVAPRRCPPHSQWLVHQVSGMQSDALSCEVSYRHFRAISTGWKYPRGKLERPNERDYVKDDELMTWMQVLKLSAQEAWANDLAARLEARDHEAKVLAARLEARDHEVKVLAAKLMAQEANLQGILSSTSWQITRPVRKLSYLFPRTEKFVGVIIRLLLWWTFTLYGQLALRLQRVGTRCKRSLMQ